ncbi:COG4223 family protein [Microvirga terricola]|uniref:Inner membrane protein n=1 Tax=Microvirga terricola TaxID=2719797 RepID=A0ABX0V8E0_9HYPH|nr:hypothetical protein [Microvirga terricola]NIX75320.1 hypothetical protein [Microvirga terricola]
MTDSSDPNAPNSTRKKTTREPATIDLRATVIDNGARSGERTAAEAERMSEETLAQPEETFDSGAGTDSIGGAALPPPASPPIHRHQTAALIGAGLIGGLVGAGLVYGFEAWRGAEDSRIAQLEQKIAALSQPGTLQTLDGRVKALETARTVFDQRLQGAQATAERASTRAEEAIKRPLAVAPAPQNDVAVLDLTKRLSALEDQSRTEGQSTADVSNAVQTLTRRTAEQDQRVAALAQKIAENSRNVESAGQAGIRLVLAERLGDALRSGMPFSDLLEGLKKTGSDPEKLKALEPFAAKGAPTASAMLQSFEPLEAQILREERAASSTWSDRLWRMIDKVVTVRPVTEPGEVGTPAILARIRQALAWGDMGGAAAAWASLPEPAQKASEDWGQRAAALAGAQQASRAISEEALTALNRSTQ